MSIRSIKGDFINEQRSLSKCPNPISLKLNIRHDYFIAFTFTNETRLQIIKDNTLVVIIDAKVYELFQIIIHK